MAPARKGARRECGPKVKTGCLTCKIRRIKCDEVKPSCKRCTSTGRKCDGYEPSKLLSKIENGVSKEVVQRLSTHLPGSAAEKRGLQFFIRNTAEELSGYYDKGFWEYLLLQASSSEPALRHGVVAIGSLHEDFRNRKLLYSSTSTGFAIDQYSKAIGKLRKSLAAGKQASLTALMACILFICFDSIRGHFTAAIVHLQSGLRILRDTRGRSTAEDRVIQETIAPIFLRLACQCILYIDTRENYDRIAFAAELMKTDLSEKPVPEQFETLEEARNSMNQAADGMFRMFYISNGELPSSQQPPEAYALYESYSTQLRHWNIAFERLMNTKSHQFDSKQIRGAALLKIQHLTVNIMSQVHVPQSDDRGPIAERVNDPVTFIPYQEDFHTIVSLARSLIIASETDAKNGKCSLTFSTDLGLIAPLYYICTHCHSKATRDEAAALLGRCPRREGMWDGEATAQMVLAFWEMKEAHALLAMCPPDEMKPPMTVPNREVVGLQMEDGMVWEWKWREPDMTNPRASTLLYLAGASPAPPTTVVNTAGSVPEGNKTSPLMLTPSAMGSWSDSLRFSSCAGARPFGIPDCASPIPPRKTTPPLSESWRGSYSPPQFSQYNGSGSGSAGAGASMGAMDVGVDSREITPLSMDSWMDCYPFGQP